MKLYSPNAERFLIYAILEQADIRRIMLPHLDERLFGLEAARAIFSRITTLLGTGKPIPKVRVMAMDPGLNRAAQQLLQPDEEDIIRARTWGDNEAKHALETLKHYYQVRTIYEMGKSLLEELDSSAKMDVEEVVAASQRALVEVHRFSEESTTKTLGMGGDISDKYILRNLKRDRGEIIPTGFPALDSKIGGWRRGNLILLTAMRGKGKSVFAKSLGTNMFYKKQDVYTCNLEMQEWEYLVRWFAETTKFAQRALRQGFVDRAAMMEVVKFKRRIDAWGQENECRWTLDTIKKPKFGPAQLHNILKHQGYDVVIIDYLSLLDAGRKELWENIYASTKYLKMMAKDLNAIVIVLGQLNDDNRAKYARAGEEDADVWIYWDIVPGSHIVHMKHGKARDYDPFRFDLYFDGAKTRFLDPAGIQGADGKLKPIPQKTMERIQRQAKEAGDRIRAQEAEERLARERLAPPKRGKSGKQKRPQSDSAE